MLQDICDVVKHSEGVKLQLVTGVATPAPLCNCIASFPSRYPFPLRTLKFAQHKKSHKTEIWRSSKPRNSKSLKMYPHLWQGSSSCHNSSDVQGNHFPSSIIDRGFPRHQRRFIVPVRNASFLRDSWHPPWKFEYDPPLFIDSPLNSVIISQSIRPTVAFHLGESPWG